jgi:hypothetical protein
MPTQQGFWLNEEERLQHALSFIMYNDVCPTLCSAAAWNVSDATRSRDVLNERS